MDFYRTSRFIQRNPAYWCRHITLLYEIGECLFLLFFPWASLIFQVVAPTPVFQTQGCLVEPCGSQKRLGICFHSNPMILTPARLSNPTGQIYLLVKQNRAVERIARWHSLRSAPPLYGGSDQTMIDSFCLVESGAKGFSVKCHCVIRVTFEKPDRDFEKSRPSGKG